MLHHVSDRKSFQSLEPYSISNNSFLRLLDSIQSQNIQTLTFFDLLKHKPSRKSIIITFDDCSRELLTFAIPELTKRNMKAVFYIPTDYVGLYNQWDVEEGKEKVDLFTEDDIINLSLNPNFEIGSHSVSHRKLSKLSTVEVLKELKDSKDFLERLIQKKVISFAYPFGELPKNNDQFLQKTGYFFGCGIYVKNPGKYALRRFIYHNEDSKVSTWLKLSCLYKVMRMIRDKF